MKRDADGLPLGIPWHTWVDDVEGWTVVCVVDRDCYLSYRARGRRMPDASMWSVFVVLNESLGIDPDREETAIVRRGSEAPLVLLGDHRARLSGKTVAGLALYYDSSDEKCPRADPSWWTREPS